MIQSCLSGCRSYAIVNGESTPWRRRLWWGTSDFLRVSTVRHWRQRDYILDIEDTEKVPTVIGILEPITPLPRPRKKK